MQTCSLHLVMFYSFEINSISIWYAWQVFTKAVIITFTSAIRIGFNCRWRTTNFIDIDYWYIRKIECTKHVTNVGSQMWFGWTLRGCLCDSCIVSLMLFLWTLLASKGFFSTTQCLHEFDRKSDSNTWIYRHYVIHMGVLAKGQVRMNSKYSLRWIVN